METRLLVTPRRLDIAVKYLFFTNPNEHENLYRWHIWERSGARMLAGLQTDSWKRSLDDYVASAIGLLQNMQAYGYDDREPVPVDPNGELFNGSHRVACALALGMEDIPTISIANPVWAPPWNAAWFREHGMPESEVTKLLQLQDELKAKSHAITG